MRWLSMIGLGFRGTVLLRDMAFTVLVVVTGVQVVGGLTGWF